MGTEAKNFNINTDLKTGQWLVCIKNADGFKVGDIVVFYNYAWQNNTMFYRSGGGLLYHLKNFEVMSDLKVAETKLATLEAKRKVLLDQIEALKYPAFKAGDRFLTSGRAFKIRYIDQDCVVYDSARAAPGLVPLKVFRSWDPKHVGTTS